MMLVQLSDIHVGSQFKNDIFDKAVEEINNLKPDALIITGDLTENGTLNEFEMAKERLNKIKIKNVIFLSGNHDYRNTGYLLFKKFFPSSSSFVVPLNFLGIKYTFCGFMEAFTSLFEIFSKWDFSSVP